MRPRHTTWFLLLMSLSFLCNCGTSASDVASDDTEFLDIPDESETAPAELIALIPSNATYAVIGKVSDGFTNRGIASATISTQNCASCSKSTTLTNANGYYVFSTTTPEPSIDAVAPAMAPVFSASKTGYKTRNIFSKPRYITAPNGKKYHMVNFILYTSTTADADRDGIPNTYETSLHLNPNDADTDWDGVPDNWENFGYNWVDYKYLGGSPVQKDLYMEVDYHFYYDGSDIVTGALSEAVQNKLKETYAAMPIDMTMPDGSHSLGINLHFVHDQALPRDFDCFSNPTTYNGDKSINNPLLTDAFYKLTICVGSQDDGDGRGAAQLTSQNLKILAPRINSTESDDLEEYAQFVRYRLIMHEMGHALGLKHGGDDNINYKPNYPSVMNYSYKWSINNAPYTLAETDIGYSEGLLPSLDENNIDESNSFPELDLDQVLFMRTYADKNYLIGYCPGTKTICSDWNGNGRLDTEPYQQRLRINSKVQTTDIDFAVLKDNNDFTTIDEKLGIPLPGNPN
ncbi:hypothetical protein K1X76_12270 [bacterium]|nr:hypothetical protein [bacterium]